MAKKMSANDAAMQQKMRVLTKLRDNCIKNEKDLQGMNTEMMLSIKDITVPEMHIIIDLQKSVKNGRLFSYLIEAQELMIPECVSGSAGNTDESSDSLQAWEEGNAYA